MLVFDSVIYNDDRHLGNFGFMRNNKTGEILRPAPIFDNGLSLFHYATDDDFEDIKAYAKARRTAKGVNHTEIKKAVMSVLQKEQLRH